MKRLCVLFVVLAFIATAGFAVAGTLDDVKAKGAISVGVNEGLFGFSKAGRKRRVARSGCRYGSGYFRGGFRCSGQIKIRSSDQLKLVLQRCSPVKSTY